MPFDFKSFIENLNEDPEKKEIVEKYENLVEPIKDKELKDTIFYKKYLSQFEMPFEKEIWFQIPKYIDEDFDWDLLIRLIGASFSSKMSIVLLYPELPRICIDVEAGEQKIKKCLDELWGFQIARMYEIYLEENIHSEIKKNEDEKEKEIVLSRRQENIQKWQKEVKRIKLYFEYLKENNE